MVKVSPLDVCVFFIWVMVLTWGSAERQYFPQFDNLTWADGRNHCQVCFSELVTLTPENIQIIMKDLSSAFWIGLRKRAVNATNQSTIYPFDDNSTFWSHWANGDPLTFQNWYPGYPMFKSPEPKQTCCSCSCTCPAPPTPRPTTAFTQNVTPTYNSSISTVTQTGVFSTSIPSTGADPNYSTESTSLYNVPAATTTATTTLKTGPLASFSTTVKPIEAECKKTPMLFQDPESDLNKNYIEDSCVAMLSFGAWVEKDCEEHLPFICYEDRFYGHVNVTDITSESATLTWERGPGDIEGYRVEVNNNKYGDVLKDLTTSIKNLTAGTFYSVKVFAVKCGRDLNPENGTFYTVPNAVSDLQVVNVTEKCVYLNWKAPVDKVDKYLIETKNIKPTETENTEVNICNLTQGNLYNFSVQSGVSDKSQWSVKSYISAYTKPAKVSNLHTSEIKDENMTLKWNKPEGNVSNYMVIWSYYNWTHKSFNNTVTSTTFIISGLPSGTRITMSVIALANHTLEGDSQTVVNFTAPKKITDLMLVSTAETINATWKYTVGSPNFTIVLEHQNKDVDKKSSQETTVLFQNLSGAAHYTVKVYSVSGGVPSSEVSKSIYTLPVIPRNPELQMKNETHLTFTWLPPLNTDTVDYVVTLNSSFWGFHEEKVLNNSKTYTFGGLKSGTNYTFMVQTIAGNINHRSEAEPLRAATDPVLKEITLSMVCSSKQILLCDASKTRDSAFEKLNSHFEDLLGDNVAWSLKSVNSGN